ncbi:MAG: hypothetical protein HYS77_00610, partial [Candidatus Rokubacteria bacterium]|nr:hypothetical protein [Candidatus Rokubacteria bacterium]
MSPEIKERQYQGKVHRHSRDLMNDWMARLARANETGEPTGAIMISGNCVELLRTFDIHPI